MIPVRPAAVLAVAALLAGGCAEDERSAFDPAADIEAPALVSFSVETDADGRVRASWSASEPVRAVVQYGPDAAEIRRYAYRLERGPERSGRVELLDVAPGATYAYAVRMTDRAGNESEQFLEGAPTFAVGAAVPPPTFLLAMVDVGWGDAIFLRAPDGTRTLVDAGHPVDARPVRAFLRRHGVTALDFASMTHVHEDHIGGFYGDDFTDVPGLLSDFPVGRFLDIRDKTPGTPNGPYGRLLDALAASPAEHVLLETGASSDTEPALAWGEDVRVTLLAAGRKDFLLPEFILGEETGSVQNNDSMIYRVQYGDFVAILMGDGEFATEQFLQNRWPRPFLEAHVHKLGHHGSNDSNSERFLRMVSPVVGLIPNAITENPGVQHPYVLSRVRKLGADYLASDRVLPNRDRALPGVRGDVLVRTNGEAFTITVENVRFE